MRKQIMNNTKGFTLIELMIAVTVIAILAAVAIPQYSAYVIDSNRKNCQGQLVSLAGRMERFWAVSGRTYLGANTALGLPINTEPNCNYTLSITASASGVANQAYILTATAKDSQTNDTGCTTMTISNTGAKTPAACW